MPHRKLLRVAHHTRKNFLRLSVGLGLISIPAITAALIFWVIIGSRERHEICKAINVENSSLRQVLQDSLEESQASIKKFPQFKEEIKRSMKRYRHYINELFANQPC